MKIKILQYGHGYNGGGILDGDICPSITTSSWHHNNFIMEPRVIQVAQIWDLEHNPVNGRVYSPDGLAPTLMTPTGGYFEPKILLEMEEKKIIPYNTSEDGVAPTITTMYERLGTENLTPGGYGKALGIMEIKSCASRKRGDEHKIETRRDEVANCVTSIDTDSMVQEPQGVEYKGKFVKEGDAVDTSRSETFGTHVMDGVSPTLRSERPDANAVCVKDGGTDYKGKFIKEGDGLYTNVSKDYIRGGLEGVSRTLKAEKHDAATCVMKGARYRIRKLTEREVFRLMDVSEEDIDKILSSGISKTAAYRLAGNSICCGVLYHIFRKMFVEPHCEEIQLSLF